MDPGSRGLPGVPGHPEHAIFLGRGDGILFFWHTYYGERGAARLAEFAGEVLNSLIASETIGPDEQVVVFSVSALAWAATPVYAQPAGCPQLIFPPGVLETTLRRLMAAERSPGDGLLHARVALDRGARPTRCELFADKVMPPAMLGLFAPRPSGPPSMRPLERVVSLKKRLRAPCPLPHPAGPEAPGEPLRDASPRGTKS